MSCYSLRCFAVGSLCLFTMMAQGAENWTGFHNEGNTSIDARGLPLNWSPTEGIAWGIELPGYGQSSPIIWKDRVYLTSIQGDDKELCLLLAIELGTGKTAWMREFPATIRLKYGEMVSRAAPTPVVDQRGAFVLFESGDLHSVAHDGTPRWHLSLFDGKEQTYKNNHGYASSLAQTEELVIVLVDHTGPSYLMAINKETGKPEWKTDRSSRSSWSSPRITRFGDQIQAVVSSAGTVDGYDALTGQLLWTCDGLSGNTIPSATVVGDTIFVGASQARGGGGPAAAASNCCVKITPGMESPFQVLWKAEKALCSYVSPLAHRGYVYYVNSVGVVYCLEAATGRQCYAERIDGPCWAQPIAVDDRIYFFTKKGVTTVLRSGPVFEQIASNKLWTEEAPPQRATTDAPSTEPSSPETSAAKPADSRPQEKMDPIVYGVAAVDDAFVVRLGMHLFRIGGIAETTSPSAE